jgi:predicted ATPase
VVCEPGELPEGATSMVELLAQLIDKSLLMAAQRPEGVGYRLLETMRAYARTAFPI